MSFPVQIIYLLTGWIPARVKLSDRWPVMQWAHRLYYVNYVIRGRKITRKLNFVGWRGCVFLLTGFNSTGADWRYRWGLWRDKTRCNRCKKWFRAISGQIYIHDYGDTGLCRKCHDADPWYDVTNR